MRPDGLKDGLILIFCPLQIERRAVARAIEHARIDENLAIICTGPGPRAMQNALTPLKLGQTRAEVGPVRLLPTLAILAGLAGGLRECEDVPPIGRVLDHAGAGWDCPLSGPASPPTSIVGLDAPVWSPDDKRRLHDQTGATLADTESHIFAAECERARLPWAVVRAISDRFDESLPPQSARWVDGRGRTRIARVVADTLRRPSLVGPLRRLGAASGRVLPLLGERVVQVIREATVTPRPTDSEPIDGR